MGSPVSPIVANMYMEHFQDNGAIPILDTLVKPEADNSLSITVY